MALRSWLAAGAVAAIAVVAATDAVRGGRAGSRAGADREPVETLAGPGVPAPGALPGRIELSTAGGCRARVVSLADLTLGRLGPATACGLWVSPDGATAAVRTRRAGTGAEIALLQLDGERPRLGERLGVAAGAVAWANDGSALAWCRQDGTTAVRALRGGATRTLPGCDPRFAAGGAVLTRAGGALGRVLLREGKPFLGADELAAALPASSPRLVTVLGYDAQGDLVAVLLVGAGSGELVQQLGLWRGRRLVATAAVVRAPVASVIDAGGFGLAGKLVRLSPGGSEVAIASLGARSGVIVLDVRSARKTVLPEQRSFAWSPDGSWLARAEEGSVAVHGAERSVEAYRLPVAADSLAWR